MITPKQLRDIFATSLSGNTSAGSNVYSGRYLPHLVNDLVDISDKKFIDINVYTRTYDNTDPRSIGIIGTLEVTLDCIVMVNEDVMDEVDALVEEVKTVLFDNNGLLDGNCSLIDGLISVNGWSEAMTINTDTDKEFVIATIIFEIQVA